jgi:hypothetical protein
MDIKDFVTAGNPTQFDSFRAGIFYYIVRHKISLEAYQFQVPSDDLGGATLKAIEKSITMMRYIRKSIEEKTFIKL